MGVEIDDLYAKQETKYRKENMELIKMASVNVLSMAGDFERVGDECARAQSSRSSPGTIGKRDMLQKQFAEQEVVLVGV